MRCHSGRGRNSLYSSKNSGISEVQVVDQTRFLQVTRSTVKVTNERSEAGAEATKEIGKGGCYVSTPPWSGIFHIHRRNSSCIFITLIDSTIGYGHGYGCCNRR